ncbi:response regulator [Paenibacillus koleovorans]|uniref:response regulator n=1 Tax=Paenibacillus koleovorans TaxID=121608 RepID=UPI000FD8C0FE|nr:response regulator [Paenibacillus koleovorans]
MLKVMLVDDETKIVEGLTVMIDWNKYGFEICGRARNGLEALQIARQLEPDLIVTDIRMPQMDGLELIREWKSTHPQTQFIILSGFTEFQYAKQAMQLGVRHYVLKPIEETALEASLVEVARSIASLREEESELNLLRSRSAAYLELQRENMLRDWIHAGKHTDEIIASLHELEVDFPYSSNSSLALVRSDGKLWNEPDLSVVSTVLTETLPDLSASYPFRFEEGELGIMFSFSGGWPEEELQRWVQLVSVKLSGHFGCTVRAAAGSIVSSMNSLNESYKLARSALGAASAANSELSRELPNEQSHKRNIIDEIKAYIDEHFDEQLTLTSIADSFYLHAHYLSQLFKKKTGVTFLHYLTHVRMEQAKQQLVSTDLKVYEISRLVGYEDSKYFSKIFERTVGMKPSEYKLLS